ncbi:hypothetical protein EOE67_12090 [Rheinheimera riviphila]|uniref:Uncharacterized protein n=1 Tax=Rheinheimera riviphila TaxID=1834037 RepID=A0A437QRB5_9GAMM|nr:hypothetical protein [Rheinheimera riviphila]RVU37044.1 hypothetical protein EOE67_12090 [Rheinheimera riviphila]
MSISAEALYKFWLNDKENQHIIQGLLQSYAQETSPHLALDFIEQLPAELCQQTWLICYKLQFQIQAGLSADVVKNVNEKLAAAADIDAMQLYLAMLAAHILRDSEQALAFYQHIQEPIAEAVLLAARIHYLKTDRQIAAQMLDQSEFMHLPAALGLRAMIALDDEAEALALSLANEALAKDPQQFDSLVVYACLANYQQRYGESAHFVNLALSKMPEQGRLLSLKGQYLLQQGDVQGALPVLQHATRNMPEHTGTVLLVGWCHLLMGDYAQAKVQFEQACEQDRSFADSHGSLAAALFYLGDLAGAKKAALVAKRLDPSSFSAAYAEALLLEQAGENELAASKIQQVYATQHYNGQGTNWDVIQRAISEGKKPNAS